MAAERLALPVVSERRARLERVIPSALFRIVLILVVAFAVAPILVVLLTSLSATQYVQLPPTGISLRWWQAALTPQWLDPLWLSVRLATITAVLAVLIGAPGAFALVRGRFPGRNVINAVVLSPVLVPQIVTGMALLIFASQLQLQPLLGFPALLVGHLVITVPYSVRTVAVSLYGLDRALEWAAQDLGADPLRTLRHVTLPLIKNGVFAGFIFAFIVSFNDVAISLFLSRPGQAPIPITILSYMEFRFDPALAAVAVITIVIVMVMIAIAERIARVSEFLYRQD